MQIDIKNMLKTVFKVKTLIVIVLIVLLGVILISGFSYVITLNDAVNANNGNTISGNKNINLDGVNIPEIIYTNTLANRNHTLLFSIPSWLNETAMYPIIIWNVYNIEILTSFTISTPSSFNGLKIESLLKPNKLKSINEIK